MIVEYLRYTIDPARQSEFKEAYAKASEPLLQSPYCLSYELCQCDEDNSQFIIRIEWTSSSDHLEKFRKSEDFRRFLTYIKTYIDDIDEMRHYTQIDNKKNS